MPKLNEYDVGDIVHIMGDFKYNNNYADPQVVRAIVRKPNSNAANTFTYGNNSEIDKSSNGRYFADLEIGDNQYGTWYYRFEGLTASGNKRGASQHAFIVNKPNTL